MRSAQIFAHEVAPVSEATPASRVADCADFNLAGSHRFALYERVDGEQSPGVAIGHIQAQAPGVAVPDAWNAIRAVGVEPSILGMQVQYWLDRTCITNSILPVQVARLAIGIAQQLSEGHPWALLSDQPDDPAREFALVGMHQQGDFQSGWRSVARNNTKYALYVACCGIIRVRQVGRRGAFSLQRAAK